MSDTPRTDAMMESIEIEEIKLIAGGNQATFSSYAMESITELARDFGFNPRPLNRVGDTRSAW